ncbi:GNAT family N-acetyltransferase [Exiguobacterium flavidum]|uniref:GNAT family N-acetyltransferase n=1 Tax=Exiguobacterium flavidum TaxID=2184695 RepID=UPI000DF805B9|nr:GNAT family N-acetyltransferase [Exiguobacterium flavidum]
MLFEFIPVDTGNLKEAVSIIHSNTEYNLLEGHEGPPPVDEIQEELINDRTTSLLVRLDGRAISVIDFLPEHPDGSLWIGLLMVHADLANRGIGKRIYRTLESEYLSGARIIRLAVLEQNSKAKRFWESLGFRFERTGTSSKGHSVQVYASTQNLENDPYLSNPH